MMLTALILALTVVLFLPTLRWLVLSWLNDPYYSHGLLIPFISAFFAWRAWREQGARVVTTETQRAQRNSVYALSLIGAGVLLHLYALPRRAYPLSATALIIVLTGIVWHQRGLYSLRIFAFPLALLFLMIPLPLAEYLAPRFEAATATAATRFVQLLGIPAQQTGAQISLPGASEFVIGAPCSGLRSQLALLTLMIIFIYVIEGAWQGKIILLAAAIPIAFVANIIRVALLLIIAHVFSAELAMRYFHTLASPVLFLLSFGLLIGLARGFVIRNA